MKNKILVIVLCSFNFMVYLNAFPLPNFNWESDIEYNEYFEDVNYLYEGLFYHSNDKEEFNRRVTWLDNKWSEKSDSMYVRMLLAISNMGRAVHDDGYVGHEYLINYFYKAENILNTMTKIPIEYEFYISFLQMEVTFLIEYLDHIGEASWEEYRLSECSAYLMMYQKLLSLYDSSIYEPGRGYKSMFDPDDLSDNGDQLNWSGTVEEYRREFEENERKRMYYLHHEKLRGFILDFHLLPFYMSFFYSQEPNNPDELEMLLDTFIEDDELRDEIIDELDERMDSGYFKRKYQKDKARREAQEK